MLITNISEAKAQLSALVEKVMAGQEVVIGKAGKPVAKLVRYEQSEKPRRPGALRARAKITSHFRIPSSGHLWLCLNRKILEIVRLFLWFYSIGAAKSNLNLGANSGNLFLREP